MSLLLGAESDNPSPQEARVSDLRLGEEKDLQVSLLQQPVEDKRLLPRNALPNLAGQLLPLVYALRRNESLNPNFRLAAEVIKVAHPHLSWNSQDGSGLAAVS
jgi:hypothetical protein